MTRPVFGDPAYARKHCYPRGEPIQGEVEREVEHEADKTCDVCGCELEFVDCWNCHGEGGFHDCGDDCCPCLHPEDDLNERCDVCHGEGGYLECPNAEHHGKEEQAK